MKLSDITDINEDILSKVGLATRPSTAARVLGPLGFFGAGLLVGGVLALLLTPKTGRGLREDLSARFRRARNGVGSAASSPAEASRDEDEKVGAST